MGLTTDQINLRDEMDRKAVSDAFFEMGGTVMGRRLNESMKQNREQTEEAVREFQRLNGLPKTGTVDEATRAALFSETAAARPWRRGGTSSRWTC